MSARAGATSLALGAALALLSRPAHARDMWTSEDGTSVFELHAFYKSFDAAYRMQRGLVEGTEALDGVLSQAGLAPAQGTLPLYGGSGAQTGRVWGRLLLFDRVELAAGYEMDATFATDPAFVQGSLLGGTIPTATQVASRRLWDFDHVIAERGGFLLQDNLDLLAVKVKLPLGEVVVGRQVLSWGTGHFWNPTDLLSPFSPTDVDREVRHGVDALRYSLPLSKTSLLDFLWLPQQQGWAQGGVVRGQANLKGFDFSLSAAKYVSDVVVGADTAGDIGPVAVHAEAAYTFGLENLDGSAPVKLGDHFLRAVAGLQWEPTSGLVLLGEYYYNGFGASDPSGYLAKLQSARVASGEIFGAGQHYLGLAAIWKATDLMTAQAMIIGNLTDPSVIAVPTLEWWVEQSVILRAGAYLPIGKSPDPRALQQLTVADVTRQSPAFISATSSLGLRSEYGASPFGFFVQVGVYF